MSTVSTDEIVVLDGDGLTVDRVLAVARGRAQVVLDEAALMRVRAAREVVERVLASGETVYGLNTGLGSLARHHIPLEEIGAFSFATVADQVSSYGRPLPTDVVRAMLVTRVNGMLKAGVGVRRELIELLVKLLNFGVHPVVRTVGSVGQGDLSEMADIGKVTIGRGWAEYRGTMLRGGEALQRAGIEPISLGPKEALGMISANAVTMGRGSLVLVDVADLIESLQIAAALSFEAFAANLSVIHPGAARARPHSGLEQAMARLRELLEGSELWQPGAARNLQDPLSIRCAPQTHGALYDALSVVRGLMEIELNAAADNPLVLVEESAIVSVGNFDVASLAMAFDYLRVAIAHAAQVANERVQKLLWSHFSGLPTGLARQEGPTGGLRPLGRQFAALASETRLHANPVSLDYRGQLAEGVEDHASMAPLSVSTTSELVSLVHRLIALELIIAAQGVDLRGGPDRLGAGTARAYAVVRGYAGTLTDETEWNADIEGLATLVADGDLAQRVARVAGGRPALSEHELPGI
ncbi:MAG TPA: aromatic amino acid ammonia-lyase [Solirubrobacteraceae bacterium]|nr:aromatic amino acid ammonia-lyase [Solirubrobacteraceae bacterium]